MSVVFTVWTWELGAEVFDGDDPHWGGAGAGQRLGAAPARPWDGGVGEWSEVGSLSLLAGSSPHPGWDVGSAGDVTVRGRGEGAVVPQAGRTEEERLNHS